MDWVWTDTTMAVGSWLQMEDIYANVYQLKCWRDIERVGNSCYLFSLQSYCFCYVGNIPSDRMVVGFTTTCAINAYHH